MNEEELQKLQEAFDTLEVFDSETESQEEVTNGSNSQSNTAQG